MAESNHRGKHQQLTQNQNNRMSDDPADGSRSPDRTGKGEKVEKAPPRLSPEEEAQQEPSMLETFGDAGAGVAAKE